MSFNKDFEPRYPNSSLSLPVRADVAFRGFEAISQDPITVLSTESHLMSEGNIHLAKYIQSLLMAFQGNLIAGSGFVNGALISHLLLRLQQESSTGSSRLPFISAEIIHEHFQESKKEAQKGETPIDHFFAERGKTLDADEPELAKVVRRHAQHMIPSINNTGKQFSLSGIMLGGAAEVYYLMRRNAGPNVNIAA